MVLRSFLTSHCLFLVFLLFSTGFLGCRGGQETASPLRLGHGEPDGRPFWNRYAGRHIYPPAFDVVDSTGRAASFFVEAHHAEGVAAAPLEHPWSSLTPVWSALPDGHVTIRIGGRTQEGDTLLLHTAETIKSPGFSAAPPASEAALDSAGLAGLEAALRLGRVQHWIEPGGPDPAYPLWVHPSKLMGVLTQGMLILSDRTEDPAVAEEARRVALAAGSFLLTLREPPGAPLAGWTHSYWDGVDREAHPIYMDQIMTLYPSEAAMAFLDLFDATGDATWWDAALAIADTYRATQRPDGTWHLLLLRETGEPARDPLLVPVSVLFFLDRLADQYGTPAYADVRKAAFEWIMRQPVQTFAWNAQFEDTRPKAQYKNLSHREAARFAQLLFETSSRPEDLAVAEELLLYVEDQFIVWTHDDAVTRTDWFKPEAKWNGNTPDGGKDWFLPAALEQYAFYTPIAGTTSNVIHAYCAAYEATREAHYRDRARALTRSLVEAQRFHGTGEIPTHLRRTLPERNWLNNSVYSAWTLMDATCL